MAFHSYTQLIQKLFNAYWCGPPSRVTGTSPWPCVDHSVSRLPPPTKRPLQARFHCGYGAEPLSLAGDGRRMVSGTISLPSSGCFSPFPHGTRTLSVSREYLALPDGPGGFTQGSTCPALLRIPVCLAKLRVRSCHPLRRRFPAASPRYASAIARSYYPGTAHRGRAPVWAVPRSLATTGGITVVFSSWGY